MAVCPNCKKILEENENICHRCWEIIDLEKYEKHIDDVIAQMPQAKRDGIIERKKQQKIVDGHIICDKCGFQAKIIDGFCDTCGHIFDLQRFLIVREKRRDDEKENLIVDKHKGMFNMCIFVPIVGLILSKKYKKKDRRISKMCFDLWKSGIRARILIWGAVGVGLFYLFRGLL